MKSGISKDNNFALESLTPEALVEDRLWWKLYLDAFPEREREPPEVILKSLKAGVGIAIRARYDDVTVGLATVHVLINPPIVFLVYLAVAAELRGRGIGSLILERAWEIGRLMTKGKAASGSICEVDIPLLTTAKEEPNQSQRRIAFFVRHGYQLLPTRYIQPPVNGVTPVPMHLMYRPAAGSNSIDSDSIRSIVRGMYLEKYHAVNGIPLKVLEELMESS